MVQHGAMPIGILSLAAACAALVPAPALSQTADKAPAKPAAYTFPQKIGIAQLANVEDFEAKNPGLGQVGQYTFQGWRMSLYVYDNNRADIAETPNAQQIKAELDNAVGDINEARKRGHYTRVDEGTGFFMPPMATPPVFQCRSFIIQPAPKADAQPPAPYESYMCVTTMRRKFLKLRLSSTTPPGDQATVFTPVAAAIEMTARMIKR